MRHAAVWGVAGEHRAHIRMTPCTTVDVCPGAGRPPLHTPVHVHNCPSNSSSWLEAPASKPMDSLVQGVCLRQARCTCICTSADHHHHHRAHARAHTQKDRARPPLPSHMHTLARTHAFNPPPFLPLSTMRSKARSIFRHSCSTMCSMAPRLWPTSLPRSCKGGSGGGEVNRCYIEVAYYPSTVGGKWGEGRPPAPELQASKQARKG